MTEIDASGNDPLKQGFGVGRWYVDPRTGMIHDGEVQLRLRPKVMAVLVRLADHAYDVLSKEDLLATVWPDVVVSESSVAVAICQLREALQDDPTEPRFIRTIPKRGYQLVAPVHRNSHPLRRKSDRKTDENSNKHRLFNWFM